MNRYRETGGEQCKPPPGLFEKTSFYYFVLKADHARLNAHVERLLSFEDKPGYHAPLPYVMLAFTHVDKLHAPNEDDGAIQYKDIAIWVPVKQKGLHGIGLFPAYMFVDNACTMATGRELFGFHKQHGE